MQTMYEEGTRGWNTLQIVMNILKDMELEEVPSVTLNSGAPQEFNASGTIAFGQTGIYWETK